MRPAFKGAGKGQFFVQRIDAAIGQPGQNLRAVARRWQAMTGRLPDRSDHRLTPCGTLLAQKHRLEPVRAVEIGQPRILGNGLGQLHFLIREHQTRRRQRADGCCLQPLRRRFLRQADKPEHRRDKHRRCNHNANHTEQGQSSNFLIPGPKGDTG